MVEQEGNIDSSIEEAKNEDLKEGDVVRIGSLSFRSMSFAVEVGKRIIEANPDRSFEIVFSPRRSSWEGNYLGCKMTFQGPGADGLKIPALPEEPPVADQREEARLQSQSGSTVMGAGEYDKE